MMISLISIIVPVYKVEAYLDECIQSLVDQTYSNLEIILVDDGSPDRCPQMCDEWGRRDSRIKVIHKPNGGLSSARNAGLDAAQGDYISFVDSDDFFDKKMYEKLYEGITRSPNIGISAIKFYKYEDGKVSVFNTKWDTKKDVLVKSGDFGILTLEQEICHAATNKLYKKSLFENVRFREGKLNEDVLFIHDISDNVRKQKVDMWDLAYYAYYYRMRSGSICHSDGAANIAVIDNLWTIYQETVDGNYKSIAYKMYCRSILRFCASLLVDHSSTGRALKEKYFCNYRQKLSSIQCSDLLIKNEDSMRILVSYWAVKHFPNVYSWYLKKKLG